jgi:hypothetical protein
VHGRCVFAMHPQNYHASIRRVIIYREYTFS